MLTIDNIKKEFDAVQKSPALNKCISEEDKVNTLLDQINEKNRVFKKLNETLNRLIGKLQEFVPYITEEQYNMIKNDSDIVARELTISYAAFKRNPKFYSDHKTILSELKGNIDDFKEVIEDINLSLDLRKSKDSSNLINRLDMLA